MTKLRSRPHSVRPGRTVFEIWEDGEVIGTVCPANGGVNIISKHFAGDAAAADVAQFEHTRFEEATGVRALAVRIRKAAC
jgi:hypothetical protein